MFVCWRGGGSLGTWYHFLPSDYGTSEGDPRGLEEFGRKWPIHLSPPPSSQALRGSALEVGVGQKDGGGI